MYGHAVLPLITLNKILSWVKLTSFCFRHCPCPCSSGGAQGPWALSLWHRFGFKAECGTGWQLVLESVCSHPGCLSCPSDRFRGEQTHCGFQPTSLCSVWYEKLWSSAHSKKKGSNSSLMMKELSLFMWVGLALIKFIAWSYRHLEFNKDNTMKTMEFLTV